jgi:hypothetical protein
MYQVLSSPTSVRSSVLTGRPAGAHAAGQRGDLDALLRELAYAYRLTEQVREAIAAEGPSRLMGPA